MTARKRVISIISIISLILAITAGVLLSVGAPNNEYVGDSVRLSNTDVTINASSSVKSGEYPADAVAISTAEELKKFIKAEEGFDGTYGYLTAENISLDWTGVGAQAYLASGRTIDGNGNTVTLSDAEAVANVSNNTGDNASLNGTDGVVTGYAGGYTDPLDGRADAAMRNYGMFVDYNMGTIKNIKFVYSQSAHSVANNSGALWKNYAGIVCGTNSGTISNCDLTVSGEFGYYYCSGNLAIDNYDDGGEAKETFATYFGGIAGRNGGTITFITAKYSAFSAKLNTRAQNFTSRNVPIIGTQYTHYRADAVTDAGGIAGVMYSTNSECSNIIIQASNDVSYNLVAQRSNKGSSKGADVKLVAAVVPANSEYSRALGGIGGANAQARIDNIIVDFNATIGDLYVNGNKESDVSRNAVVFCGKATDVTIFNVENDNDYQTDHCGCVTTNEGRQHDTGYGNLIHTDDHTNVSVGFDSDGNQVITVEPKETQAHILGEVTFSKYEGKNGGNPIVENNPYAGVPGNGSMYVYNNVDARTGKYTFTIKPYQTGSSSRYWEINTYAYEVATISNVGASEYTYTGEDYLLNQLNYTSSSKNGAVNPEGINARTAEGKAITSGRLPGEYAFVLADKEAGLSYVDTQNKVVAFVEETPTQYSFKVNLAQITPLDSSLINGNWMTTPQDFTFELTGGIEGAADGYQYEVGGSLPTPVTGLVMKNDKDTNNLAGRTYKIELTSGGVVVTEPYTYTVRIDLTAPTAEITHYEHPADRYYTHNKITIKADDRASGVASIIMNSYDGDSTTPTHSHNIMAEGIDNGDGTYTWRFQDTGRKEIVVTDNAGHTSTIEVNVKIDTTMPTLTVDAYYFVDEEIESGSDSDGNPIYTTVQRKVPYTNDSEGVTSAVYFEASATFGESGGQIRYSLDNGATWEVYEGIVIVKSEKFVKFRAVSNTYDHPEDDVYPYPNRYPLVDNWGNQTMHVVINLPEVVITLEDLVIENATKPFDGTNAFLGSVSVKEGFEEANDINGEVQITSVVYADVNASDSVKLIISVFCTDDTKLMDNQIEGAMGVIEKKVIDVTIDDKTKIYGVSLPQLTYTQIGMVEGFEESVNIYVQKPDGYTGSYELLPQTADGEGYVIAVVDGTTFVNYTLGNVTKGRLKVTLAPVDRLVYERGQFTGLDLNNIADRNLEIGFIRSNGNYEKLNVTFYARDYYFDSSDNSFVDNGYTNKVDDITKAGAGFFKVVISLPERDAKGELLTDKYVMDEDITEFMIKIIDSTIFDVEEEEEPSEPDVDEDDKTEQETPAVNNGANANGQVSIYEDNSANTDSTDIDIESAQQKRDYVAMISIFCAVAITIAFAIGVARAITKRIRR